MQQIPPDDRQVEQEGSSSTPVWLNSYKDCPLLIASEERIAIRPLAWMGFFCGEPAVTFPRLPIKGLTKPFPGSDLPQTALDVVMQLLFNFASHFDNRATDQQQFSPAPRMTTYGESSREPGVQSAEAIPPSIADPTKAPRSRDVSLRRRSDSCQ